MLREKKMLRVKEKIELMSRANSPDQAVSPAAFVTKEGKVENHQIILSQRRTRTPFIFDEETSFSQTFLLRRKTNLEIHSLIVESLTDYDDDYKVV